MRNLSIRSLNQESMEQVITLLKKQLPFAKFGKITPFKRLDQILKIEWDGPLLFEEHPELINSVSVLIKYPDEFHEQVSTLIRTIKPNYVFRNKSVWLPSDFTSKTHLTHAYIGDREEPDPKYHIYVISLGRANLKSHTAVYLEKIGIKNYSIVIEPHEVEIYRARFGEQHLLVTPISFSIELKMGSTPVRNFVLEHSRANGDLRHWILDDNISHYGRFNYCNRYWTYSKAVFKVIEDYVEKFSNVKLAGHNYDFFCPGSINIPPITVNTRIYSSILVSNDILDHGIKWRLKYNEDTDLSIEVLKAGFSTILFNILLCYKETTMLSKGGNTDTIYAVQDAHYLKSKAIVDAHPDIAKFTNKRFNNAITGQKRWHHFVNYKKIQGIKSPDLIQPHSTVQSEYGMVLLPRSEIPIISNQP